MTRFWQYRVYADTRGGSLDRGRQMSGVVENVDFRTFGFGSYVFGTLGNEANIII